MKKQAKKITTEDFDRQFDKGEDMADFLDLKKAQVNKQIHRIIEQKTIWSGPDIRH